MARAGIGVGVFVKTPELSEVKTRLARDVGKDVAREVYERSLAATREMCLQVMRRSSGSVQCYWAVGEIGGVGLARWRSLPAFHTGEGALGSRLATVQDWLLSRHGRAVLLGSDCPQLSPDILLAESFREGKRVVIGPASDGGFYLFSSRHRIPRKEWESIEYSSPATLRQLMEHLETEDVELLSPEEDIDDLRSLRNATARLSEGVLESQREMAQWLQGCHWFSGSRECG